MQITTEQVLNALGQVIEPDLKKDLVSLGMIRDLEIEGHKVRFSVVLTTPACPLKESIKNACIRAVHELVSKDADVEVNLTSKVTSTRKQEETLLKGVKNIIAVASGKGGVGKSTVAANLAITLARSGARTGLLDADIYGPSVPLMFQALDDQLQAVDIEGHTKVLPLKKHGVSILSIGFFVDASRALIWRGPMASGALKQLFTDADWGELDYMIIDLPPGTGDIHLSLVQTVPLTGAIIVTTPQEVALADARKAVSMFSNDNIHVPVLGVVENMAWFTPAELPENKYYIFGHDGGKQMAEAMDLPFLGQIPLIQSVREAGDQGKPEVLHHNSLSRPYFDSLAEKLAQQVSISNARKNEIVGV
ncbi:MAG: Mrp/NBP35 family ATP-binding protein [Bacteroidales bacterium]|nr:Mrp/NBP35 family ATP-binding protein [Bacteroidales bacterium]NLM92414.1 Mrp/NBP35 family ATP-binding protein [Bacteroidales bacterium]